jgi:DNA-directed RNA polymerase specialized sigma24 family protein
VLAALGRLRPRAREALLLVSAAGLRPAQAARVLGISPAAFRMRLSSARRALDKAVAAEAAASADQRREEPVTSVQNPHLKEAVN